MFRLNAETLLAIRRHAEDAVRDMPDGDIKTTAFAVLLWRLLCEPHGIPRSASRSRAMPRQLGAPSIGAQIVAMRDAGFFGEPRGIGEIREELAKRGRLCALTSLSGQLLRAIRRRDLSRRRIPEGVHGEWKYSVIDLSAGLPKQPDSPPSRPTDGENRAGREKKKS